MSKLNNDENEVRCPFIRVYMLQMCSKFIVRQLSRLQIITFSSNLAENISVVAARLPKFTQEICLKTFSEKGF